MSIELDQFHEVFFAESFEALDAMEGALLQLSPGTADSETINTIFRVAHSIKGGAGMFGFNEIASFTHTLETLLDELRSGRIQPTAQLCDALLQSVDEVRSMMSATQQHQVMDTSAADVLQELFKQAVAEASATDAAPAATVAVATVTPAIAPERTAWRIGFRALPELLVRGNDPLRMFEELAGLGELEVHVETEGLPDLELLDPMQCHLQWSAVLKTSAPRSSIDLIFEWAEGDCELSVARQEEGGSVRAPEQPAVSSPPSPPVPQASAAAPRPMAARLPIGGGDASSIRVGIEKIDELLNTVGEIVITQSMLGQLAAGFEGVRADRLRAGLTQLESNVRELQESVMRVRMLPVGSVFSRFPRLVHDLSSRLGKKIRLQINGEQTEVDKTVLEKIGDPLVHLVRNSIDHGIEAPADRVAAGKSAEGTVRLDACHKGGAINIIISDDGKGLDKAHILQKGREKGLVGESAVLSDPEIYDLIFQPGFSTAAQATDLSGRGVGMDVVRRNITELGGNVELSSAPGAGTTTTITLPLTLAIVDGQLVAVGEETYIVPLVAIVESLQLRPGVASQVYDHGEVIPFRGEYLPIIRLHEMFGVEPHSRELSEGLVMVVEGDGRRAGLFIDKLLGQQQVVIKSMETNYTRIEGIGGATILGEGTVSLILDIPGLLRMARATTRLRTGT